MLALLRLHNNRDVRRGEVPPVTGRTHPGRGGGDGGPAVCAPCWPGAPGGRPPQIWDQGLSVAAVASHGFLHIPFGLDVSYIRVDVKVPPKGQFDDRTKVGIGSGWSAILRKTSCVPQFTTTTTGTHFA